MPIDDRIEAFKKAYPETTANNPAEAALAVVKSFLPEPLSDLFGSALGRLSKEEQEQRFRDLVAVLQSELKDITGRMAAKQDVAALMESVQLIVRNDVWEWNDKKRERYVRIVGNALRSETLINDLASYIQDVEQLGERDVLALKVLNEVMNKKGDWNTVQGTAVHPGTFVQRRDELAKRLANAFGVPSSGHAFSREEGYEACTRLQGFGLAHEIDTGPRQIPMGDFSFRPSKRGLMLLKLIGEQVENWDKYFPSQG